MKQLSYSELTKKIYFLPVKGSKIDITNDIQEFINSKLPLNPDKPKDSPVFNIGGDVKAEITGKDV